LVHTSSRKFDRHRILAASVHLVTRFGAALTSVIPGDATL
jgi:hypothetical protein